VFKKYPKLVGIEAVTLKEKSSPSKIDRNDDKM